MTAEPQVPFGHVNRLRWNFALPEWARIAIGGHCTFPGENGPSNCDDLPQVVVSMQVVSIDSGVDTAEEAGFQ